MSTETVLNHHLQAFAEGDVEEILKDFTGDSVVMMPHVTLKGLDNLRAAFTELFSGLFKPGTYTFAIDRKEIAGEVAYIVWHSENQGAKVPLGTDTFLIRNGKIVVQTFAAKIEMEA